MVAVVFKLCRELCRELCRVGEEIDFGVEPLEIQGLQLHDGYSFTSSPRSTDNIIDMDVVPDLGCSFDPEPAGDLEARSHGELPTQCGEKGSTKLATKLATKKNHTQNPEAPKFKITAARRAGTDAATTRRPLEWPPRSPRGARGRAWRQSPCRPPRQCTSGWGDAVPASRTRAHRRRARIGKGNARARTRLFSPETRHATRLAGTAAPHLASRQ